MLEKTIRDVLLDNENLGNVLMYCIGADFSFSTEFNKLVDSIVPVKYELNEAMPNHLKTFQRNRTLNPLYEEAILTENSLCIIPFVYESKQNKSEYIHLSKAFDVASKTVNTYKLTLYVSKEGFETFYDWEYVKKLLDKKFGKYEIIEQR